MSWGWLSLIPDNIKGGDLLKKFIPDKIRNIGIFAHGGAGKTSLAEVILYNGGAAERLGRVEDGNTIMDHDPEEVKRQISINSSIAPCEWKNHKINVVDTPGYFDFIGEIKSALRVVDGALITVCAASGVEVGTENVWEFSQQRGLPRMIFINKMDRENANFQKTLEQLRETFGPNVVPLQLPIGQEASFKGVVDMIQKKAYTFENKKMNEIEIPEELKSQIDEYYAMIAEAVAESNDELLMKYLEGEELTEDEIQGGLRAGVISGRIVPVLCGSATGNKGIQLLLDTILSYMPSPEDIEKIEGINPKTNEKVERMSKVDQPFSALVFKTMADPYVGKLTLFKVFSGGIKSDSTVYNASSDQVEKIGQIFLVQGKKQIPVDSVTAGDIVAVAKLQYTTTGDTLCDKDKPIIFEKIEFPKPSISLSVEPKAKGDEDKIGSGLQRLAEEDPTFTVKKDTEVNQMIISGIGELHLEIICNRLASKFGAEVELKAPKIPYKETIKGSTKIEGKHKKQSGGRGQFGHVWLELEPLYNSEESFEFVDKIFGGSVPRQYIPAVEKGLRESLVEGILAGYPVVNVKATLVDGSYHAVDSSEMAFKIAASMAFKKGVLACSPVLLEPIYNVSVTVPDAYMGDIIGDLNKKRGKIMGMEPIKGGFQIVKGMVPQGEMVRYATDLRSMTQGRGSFEMVFDHYEEVPTMFADKIIETAKKNKEND